MRAHSAKLRIDAWLETSTVITSTRGFPVVPEMSRRAASPRSALYHLDQRAARP